MKTTVILEITHKKPIKDLTDFVANRIWSMDRVDDVSARIWEEDTSKELAGSDHAQND